MINRTNGLGRVGLLTSNKFRKLVSRLIIPTALRESLELNRRGRSQGVHHLEVVARDLGITRCIHQIELVMRVELSRFGES